MSAGGPESRPKKQAPSFTSTKEALVLSNGIKISQLPTGETVIVVSGEARISTAYAENMDPKKISATITVSPGSRRLKPRGGKEG